MPMTVILTANLNRARSCLQNDWWYVCCWPTRAEDNQNTDWFCLQDRQWCMPAGWPMLMASKCYMALRVYNIFQLGSYSPFQG